MDLWGKINLLETLLLESKTSVTLGGTKHLKMHDHVIFFNLTQLTTHNDQGFQVYLVNLPMALFGKCHLSNVPIRI